MTDSAPVRARSAWSAGAKRVFRDVMAANPGLDSVKLSALFGACDLHSEADKMQAVIEKEGYVVPGSTGQAVAHPLVAEVRQYRRGALETLKSLGLDGRAASSQAGAALASKRWSSRPSGGNVTPIRSA